MNALILVAIAMAVGQTAPLTCDQAVVDRGQVRGGPVLTLRFTLANRGTAAVNILEARVSCGCLTPQLSARMLQPGESAALDLEIGTISQPEGPNLWSVRLLAQMEGGPPTPLALQVKANLVREVSLEPSAIRLFGGAGLSHEITLIDRRAKPFEITAVRCSSKRIVAQDETWQRSEQGWIRKIRVGLAPDGPAGKFEDAVHIFGNDPDYRELRVAVTGERRDKQRYLVTPGEVQLEFKPGKPTPSFLVLIRDHEGQPIEIEKVETDDPALSVRFAGGANTTAAVRISVNKGQTPARSNTLRVQVRKPVPKTLVIPVGIK
jgi:hypothetical protein